MAVSFVQTPLTVTTALTSWRWDVPTLAMTATLALGYCRALASGRTRGADVTRSRRWAFLVLGCGVWAVAATSFVGVYADTLFWVRALQVVLLLMVVPFGLALGRPVTAVRATVDSVGRDRFDRALAGRPARFAGHPATTSIAMLATPWLLYLTGWYPAVLEHAWVDQGTRIVLVVVGFGYFYARLQADPVPRRYPQTISLTITVVEVLGDGLLGIVLWLGPLIATDYYGQFTRAWGPDPRTDQIIGAGILWILGDVIGIPFLLALMRAFLVEDRAAAGVVDAELDAAERATDTERSGPSRGDLGPPVAPGLWWEADAQLQDRFRRERREK